MRLIAALASVTCALATPAFAQGWAVFTSERFGFSMFMPPGMRWEARDIGDGWGGLRARKGVMDVGALVKVGAAGSAQELEALAVATTRIPAANWTMTDQGAGRRGWDWWRTYKAQKDEGRVLFVTLGTGGRGSYIFFMETGQAEFTAHYALYEQWYQSLTLRPPSAGGRVVFQVAPPSDARFAALQPVLGDQRLSALAEAISRLLVLPRDLPVRVEECGTVNAFYDPRAPRVVLCYELAEFFREMHSRKQGVDAARAPDYVLHAMIFTLLHELGHAIIGELDLGVTGGEEDAVDDFAGLALLEGGQAGLLLDGAEAMLDMGALSRGQLPFHDEHSFSAQRFYNLLCLGYGRQPQELQILVDRGQLPRQRAVRCADEYRKKRKAWEAMTVAHARR
jgi:hypothetical protein